MLDAFGAGELDLTLADLGQRTGLAKTTVHRLANELVGAGLLDRDGLRYRLGVRLFQLGMRASTQRGLIEVATPFMEDLYERTHEIVHLGVREQGYVVYLAKIGGHRQAASPSRIGGRMPLHCTAVGKVLLAHAGSEVIAEVLGRPLARVAARTVTSARVLEAQLLAAAETGLAFEHEESAPGLACVAAPVFAPEGAAVAAISVAGALPRFRPEQHRGALRAAAAGVTTALLRRHEFQRLP